MTITYRPLDRSRSEIRLLKILAPEITPEELQDPLKFAPGTIHCQLEYESLDRLYTGSSQQNTALNNILDYMLQDTVRNKAENDPDTAPEAYVSRAKDALAKHIRTNTESQFEMDPRRKETLELLYKSSDEKMKAWLPPESEAVADRELKDWLQTWIWTPLSGSQEHVENRALGYFALSYLWKDHIDPNKIFPDRSHRDLEEKGIASGLTPQQCFEVAGISPSEVNDMFGTTHSQKVEIVVNGTPILVEANLEKALRTVREIPEIQHGTRIWVDALCINQSDVLEKNIEVKRMGDIYKKAERVISFLGDSSDDSGETLEFMSTIGRIFSRGAAQSISHQFLERMNLDAVIGVARLLMRPYWKRIWIAQEICLGGDRAIAVCGARRFSLPELLRCGPILGSRMLQNGKRLNLQLLLNPRSDGDVQYLNMEDVQVAVKKLMALHYARLECENDDREVPQTNALWFRIPSGSRATDPRDLVYGMMNLLPKKFKAQINVEYAPGNKFVDVMADFTKAHIRSTNDLSFILHQLSAPIFGLSEWPTWVPNLTLPYSSAHYGWPLMSEPSACPGTTAEATFSRDAKTGKHLLVCRGYRLDTISQATRPVCEISIEYKAKEVAFLENVITYNQSIDVQQRLLNAREELRILKSRHIPDTEDSQVTELPPSATWHKYDHLLSLKMALMECFQCLGVKFEREGYSIFDIPYNLNIEQQELRLQRIQYVSASFIDDPGLSTLNSVREAFANFNLWGTAFKDLFPPDFKDVDPHSVALPNIPDRTVTLARLLTTCEGHVGTCIGHARPGDEIFLLHGCTMPVILRASPSCDGAYELKGGVYVPGVMNGEAFARFQASDTISKVITIC
ncbi:heterokaryon incompatibility protein-domain-containing protein [Bisporella sp. PMI_857]|nr:heterokaryon incompatibility protein-domain-containing protein [Bisporella sp. PMI_857]